MFLDSRSIRRKPEIKKKSFTSGEVRTHALKRGPELESGALTTRPQMLLQDLQLMPSA